MILGGANETRRWTGAFVLVLGLHVLPGLIAATWLASERLPSPAEPAIYVDMAPPSAPSLTPVENPPGLRQDKAEEAPPSMVADNIEAPLVKNPAVPIPTQPVQRPQVERAAPAREATAPPAVAAPPAQRVSNAAPTWQGLVLGQLNKFKRYPVSAQFRKQQGVPWVRFTMDRDGKVVSVAMERSSGVDALDREALALPKRAQPFPKPPADVSGQAVELVVPVEFFLR